MSKREPTSADFRNEILTRIQNSSATWIEIRSGDVRADIGGENSVCSAVMKSLFCEGDVIVGLPAARRPSLGGTFEEQTAGQNHQGGNLVIRYQCGTDRSELA